jgi:hypothetical protein
MLKTRASLALLARRFDWRSVLVVVQPAIMMRWHSCGSQPSRCLSARPAGCALRHCASSLRLRRLDHRRDRGSAPAPASTAGETGFGASCANARLHP